MAIVQNATHSIFDEKVVQEYNSFQVIDIHQNRQIKPHIERHYVQIHIEGIPESLEIDSESRYTFLPFEIILQLKFDRPLQPSTIRFRYYTQDIFAPHGKTSVNIN